MKKKSDEDVLGCATLSLQKDHLLKSVFECRGHTKPLECFQSTYSLNCKRIGIISLSWQKIQGNRSFISIKRTTGHTPIHIHKHVGQRQELSIWTKLVEHSRSQANNFQSYLCHEHILIYLKPACISVASIINDIYWQAHLVAGFEVKPNRIQNQGSIA